jgi:hypothetical protein
MSIRTHSDGSHRPPALARQAGGRLDHPGGQPTAGRGLLPVLLTALALVVAAVPSLNVTPPALATDTGASLSQLQWIVDAYALVFAGLLLPAGAFGDHYGRRPVLVLGLAVFASGSGGAAFNRRRRDADRAAWPTWGSAWPAQAPSSVRWCPGCCSRCRVGSRCSR